SRTASLTGALESSTSSLSKAIEDKTANLSNLLSDGGITLVDLLQERGDNVTAALEMLGIRVADDITSRANQAEFLLATLTRQLDESVSIQLNAMDSRLQSAVIEINGALDDTSERARLTLSTAGQDSLNLFDTRLTEITSLLDE